MKTNHALHLTTSLISACIALTSAHADDEYDNFNRKRMPVAQKSAPSDSDDTAKRYQPRSSTYRQDTFDLSAHIKGGYRRDDLKWNIGAPPYVNILSELTWEDVTGYQVAPSITYTRKAGDLKGFTVQVDGYMSQTKDGKNQDSDYLGNNRTLEFSRSNNDASDGDMKGFSAGIGYSFEFKGDKKENIGHFMMLFGYALQKQNFVMQNGFQTIPANGPFAGLNSTYDTTWSMGFVGAALEGKLAENHRLNLHGKYFVGNYNGVGNWNLRSDFAHPKSFEHDADAYGFNIGLEYGWMFYSNLELTLSADYQGLYTKSGTDDTYFADGTVVTAPLNEVESTSQQYMLGLGYTF